MRSKGFYVNEKSTDTGWDRTSDLPICSTVPRSPTWAVKSTLKPSTINRSRPASDCAPTLSGSYYHDFPHLNEFETAKLSRLTENGFQFKTIWCSLRISEALVLVRSGNLYMVVTNGNILLHVALKYSQRSDNNAHHLLQC